MIILEVYNFSTFGGIVEDIAIKDDLIHDNWHCIEFLADGLSKIEYFSHVYFSHGILRKQIKQYNS